MRVKEEMGEMGTQRYTKWLVEKLLGHLPPRSVLVMANAQQLKVCQK